MLSVYWGMQASRIVPYRMRAVFATAFAVAALYACRLPDVTGIPGQYSVLLSKKASQSLDRVIAKNRDDGSVRDDVSIDSVGRGLIVTWKDAEGAPHLDDFVRFGNRFLYQANRPANQAVADTAVDNVVAAYFREMRARKEFEK